MSSSEEGAQVLREEMDARGWHNNDWRAGLAAIVGGESNFVPSRETGYSHTANDRIRRFFSKARNLSDDELNRVKSTDRTWFDFIYGGRFGNTAPDDGFNYRGGGYNQLTFKDNYKRYGDAIGVDLVAHPDLIVAPRIAAAVAVEYMRDRFQGGDFSAMKAAVGNSVGEPDRRKNELYEAYTQSGEWDFTGTIAKPATPKVPGPVAPVIADFLAKLQAAENFLTGEKLYTGPVDYDPGPGFRAALRAYLAKNATG